MASIGTAQKAVHLPPDLESLLADYDKSDRQARRVLEGLSDDQANWQPSPASWSIAQCLDHLAIGNKIYAAALQQAIQPPRAAGKARRDPIRPGGWFSAYFLRSMEPPPRQKWRAPKKIVPPSRIGAREALDAFLRANDDLRAIVRQGAPLDLNRIRFHNPFVGIFRFTVATGLLLMASHNRRHLWQADQVRHAPGFPQA
jgi:hypothetical protein